ncbi:MBL fold metallo-hydrolase [Caulobacter segnis]|uniref:MBL fold metallo-hydrolase n=1 Tax=Caulobacter segnis TaxID=88688 RepID=UPI00240FA8CB|nr:MBL fold metallo-hydrolase [Caulobacter segnis]MDG2520998.1 MBL fold metallo-hydrolase [Caulobacter segnis]
MQPEIQAFVNPDSLAVIYLIVDPSTGLCAFVDPILDIDPVAKKLSSTFVEGIVAKIREKDMGPTWVLQTGIEGDRITAAGRIKYLTGGSTCIGAEVPKTIAALCPLAGIEVSVAGVDSMGYDFDKLARGGDPMPMGSLKLYALPIPGRTPEAVAYRVGNAVFVGTALNMPSEGAGPTDLPTANPVQFHQSLRRLLTKLPEGTKLYHSRATRLPDGTLVHESTIGDHRRSNPHVGDDVSETAFAAMRGLAPVALTPTQKVALKINLSAGRLAPK